MREHEDRQAKKCCLPKQPASSQRGGRVVEHNGQTMLMSRGVNATSMLPASTSRASTVRLRRPDGVEATPSSGGSFAASRSAPTGPSTSRNLTCRRAATRSTRGRCPTTPARGDRSTAVGGDLHTVPRPVRLPGRHRLGRASEPRDQDGASRRVRADASCCLPCRSRPHREISAARGQVHGCLHRAADPALTGHR